jgi:hypothetical protein
VSDRAATVPALPTQRLALGGAAADLDHLGVLARLNRATHAGNRSSIDRPKARSA